MIYFPKILRWISPVINFCYVGGAVVHQKMYDWKILRKKSAPLLVVSVGSIISGGAGKTPFVIWLASLLQGKGYRVAVLSRGYKREKSVNGRESLIVSDGRTLLCTPQEGGDEPLLIARHLCGVPVVVGKDRHAAALLALSCWGTEIVLLDDGMQHRRLAKDLEIVLVDATRPLGEGLPLSQRDPGSALKRADLLVLTRTGEIEQSVLEELRMKLRRECGAPLIETAHRLEKIEKIDSGESVSQEWLKGLRLFAFAGIANPESFDRLLRDQGIRAVGKEWFRDHQKYDQRVIASILKMAKEAGAEALVTTSKDAVKLNQAQFLHIPLYVVSVGIKLITTDDNSFFEQFQACLKVNIQ
ncbi:MAG: tetraacyldisaccharide 4'-kinase [Deltaproteobacteria bacterium]|nr:tetraacyldisaccharide 4'-kinase [Deltaproteobacteria bacterium]